MRPNLRFVIVIIFCISIILNLSITSEVLAENINAASGENIQSKINIALANSDNIDYIYIAAGTFEEQIIIVISPGQELHLIGSGPDTTIISLPSSKTGNVISCDGGGKIFLDDMKIMNGTRSGISINNNTYVYLNTCTISNNSNNIGGGINNYGGNLDINYSLIENNSALLNGGGIYNDGSLNVSNSKIINNSSSLSTGGGIYNAGTLNISNSSIANNSDGIDTITSSSANIATSNWWGSESGPYNAINNPLGTGNSIAENINFYPFLSADPFIAPVQEDELPPDGGQPTDPGSGNNISPSNNAASNNYSLNGSNLVFKENGSFSLNHYLNFYGTPSRGFIALLYHSILGREPDIEGSGYWQEVLENNSMSASEIAECFFFSEENISRIEQFDNSDFIKYLYNSILFRDYDISGYDDCLKCMAAGASKQYLFDAFTGSKEWSDICNEFNLNP